MRKVKELLGFACSLCICLSFISCGGITVKGENGQTYESYQECCAAQDFMAAHTYLAKMENAMGDDGDKEQEYQKARDYVFNAEMLYLTSLGTEEASNRIVYLLAEYQIPAPPVSLTAKNNYTDDLLKDVNKYIEDVARFNKRCDNVLDMAIAQGNMELAKKILYIYKGDVNVAWQNDLNLTIGDPVLVFKSKKAAQERYEATFGKIEEKDELKEEDHNAEKKTPKGRKK